MLGRMNPRLEAEIRAKQDIDTFMNPKNDAFPSKDQLQTKYDEEYAKYVKIVWMKSQIYEINNKTQEAIDTYKKLMEEIMEIYGPNNAAYIDTNKKKNHLIIKMSRRTRSTSIGASNIQSKNKIIDFYSPYSSTPRKSFNTRLGQRHQSVAKRRKGSIFDSLNQKASVMIERSMQNTDRNIKLPKNLE